MLFRYLLPLIYLLAFLLFFIRGFVVLDPDFGWHLKVGELISKSGIPSQDTFSYTMPSYPYVYHDWLTDLAIFYLYPFFGLVGLALFFGLIALIALLISIPAKSPQWAQVVLLIPAIPILYTFAGVRPQVISWLLFALLTQILLYRPKFKLFLPLVFLAWVNLHGAFAIGIVILALVFLLESWFNKRINKLSLMVLILSLGATLLNPYGVRIWSEVWETFSSTSLHLSIAEWLPIIFRVDFTYLIVMTLSLILIIWYRRKLDRTQLILYELFLLAGLSSQRHVPLWLILTIPLTINLLAIFYHQVVTNKDIKWRFWQVYKIGLLVICVLGLLQTIFLLKDSQSWQEDIYYPAQAVNFLKSRSLQGQIFSTYEWGGYLIWKLPGQKVFVDGRMPSWQRKNPPSPESPAAYQEYRQLIFAQLDPSPIFKKYKIRYVLWPKPVITPDNNLDKFFNKVSSKPKKDFINQIKEAGAKIIYQDQTATIYEL